jgi:hypothetical protein
MPLWCAPWLHTHPPTTRWGGVRAATMTDTTAHARLTTSRLRLRASVVALSGVSGDPFRTTPVVKSSNTRRVSDTKAFLFSFLILLHLPFII